MKMVDPNKKIESAVTEDSENDTPKFGRLLIVLLIAVIVIIVITFTTEAYYSN